LREASSEHFSVDGTLIEAWAQHEGLCAEGGLAKKAIFSAAF
jgi:hypothetical protein